MVELRHRHPKAIYNVPLPSLPCVKMNATSDGYTPSADVDAAISIARELGATVSLQGDGIRISNGGIPKIPSFLHCGESGLSARMFSAIAALSPERVTIMGQGSLNERPFTMVEEALSQLGKTVELNNGRLPMSLSGTMRFRLHHHRWIREFAAAYWAAHCVAHAKRKKHHPCASSAQRALHPNDAWISWSALEFRHAHEDFKRFVIEWRSAAKAYRACMWKAIGAQRHFCLLAVP
jgi:hypothetical protein